MRYRNTLAGLLLCIATSCGGSDPVKSVPADDTELDSAETGLRACPPVDEFLPEGCLVVRETDPEARGRWPDIERSQHDAAGRMLSRDTRGGEQPDTERFCRLEWDGDNLLSEACAGVSVYRYDYTYSSDGLLESSTYDAGSDGEVDKSWTHLTDALGQVLESAVDDDMDGTPDALQTFAYDADGHLIDETWDYTYDGTVDFRRSHVYEDGLLVQDLEDSDGDGTDDVEVRYEYDDTGRLVRSERFEDGSSRETTTWTYEDCMLASRLTIDAGGNRSSMAYVVDDLDRITLQTEDWDDDGAADRIWATEWTCPGDTR